MLVWTFLTVPALADVTTPISEEIWEQEELVWEEPTEQDEPKWEEPSGGEDHIAARKEGTAFPDVPETAEYASAVEALADMGIITGDNKGNFNPNDTINRAEAAAIICRMVGVEEEAKASKTEVFHDVSAAHWAVGYVAKAAGLGIINGYGDGNFGPSDPVTYGQIIKMLVCAWGYEEAAKANGGWPNGYLTTADTYGISTGAMFSAEEKAPRGQVALLCYCTVSIPRGQR